MTTSEFIFLVLGVGLGVAAGAALIEILRARPPVQREVRLTVAQDAVPRRRAATLADDAFAATPAEPARGGPADHLAGDDLIAMPPADHRTSVPPTAVPAAALSDGPVPGVVVEPAFRLADPPGTRSPDALVGVPVERGDDPMLAALRASAAASAVAAMRAPTKRAVATAGGERAVASDDPPGIRSGDSMVAASGAIDPGGTSGASDTGGAAPPDPCDEQRRLADERCELASRARVQADAAADAARAAQRAYDEHETRAAQAAAAADARAVRLAKDDAQARFRAGRAGSTTTDEVEAAARAWLLDINQINGTARDAAAVMEREREAARAIGGTLERLSLDADAARIAAEAADAACVVAREAVAECQERATAADRLGHMPAVPSGAPIGGTDTADDDDLPLSAALGRGGTPRIFRMLRGDRVALTEIVGALAGDDAAERRRWQSGLSDLVDAILADAIEASALEFPTDDAFWSPFTLVQDREITAALSSLGYRFDGRGGWVDDRIPSQRDLSLALGYAGLDPMRMRQWPTEAEMRELYADVNVAADEHLAARAGDLTLGELVTMLGRRADGLTDIWNDWGRIRPLLLEEV